MMSRIYVARIYPDKFDFQPVAFFSRIVKLDIATKRKEGVVLEEYSDLNDSGDLIKLGLSEARTITFNVDTNEMEVSVLGGVLKPSNYDLYKKAINKAERMQRAIEVRALQTFEKPYSSLTMTQKISVLFAEFNVVGGTIQSPIGPNKTFSYKPRAGSNKAMAENLAASELILTSLGQVEQ